MKQSYKLIIAAFIITGLLVLAFLFQSCTDDYSLKSNDVQTVGPTIFSPYWEPEMVTYDPVQKSWSSHLVFGVCDPDNDLLGGAIYPYLKGTNELIWSYAILWYDFYSLPDVSNCDDPAYVGIPSVFAATEKPPGMENGRLCIDLQITDGDGNFSNLICDICVTIP